MLEGIINKYKEVKEDLRFRYHWYIPPLNKLKPNYNSLKNLPKLIPTFLATAFATQAKPSIVYAQEQTNLIADMNNNRIIDVGDSIALLNQSINPQNLTDLQQAKADVNFDNKINVLDAIEALNLITNSKTPFYIAKLTSEVKALDINNANIPLPNINVCLTDLLINEQHCNITLSDGIASFFFPYKQQINHKLIINDPAGNYYEHVKEALTVDEETLKANNFSLIYNIELVPSSYDMAWHDSIFRSEWTNAHQRWLTPPNFYIINEPVLWDDPDVIITQEMVDTVLEVLTSDYDLRRFTNGFVDNSIIEIGNNPPWGQNGNIIIWWSNNIGGSGVHSEWLNSNEIVYATVTLGTNATRWVYLAEISQTKGARRDPPWSLNNPTGGRGVFIDGKIYYSDDYNLGGNFLYNREEGSKTPDISP